MGDRPLFRDEASFRRLYEERLPYYRQADYRIESSGESIRVVEQILALGIFGRSAGVTADGTAPGHPRL
jgi:shikimate kinase